MEKDNLPTTLKIFCPTHQSIFEIEQSPKIVCEIKGHALSNDFPKGEFWEYCCDCQTFSPSNFGTGGKVKKTCQFCEREVARRFLCDECKVFSVDSDEETKGKIFSLNATNGIEPNCVGCHKSFTNENFYLHKCQDIEGDFLTNRQDCPFCKKAVLSQVNTSQKVENFPTIETIPKHEDKKNSTQCPNCEHWGIAGRIHCGKCGIQINTPSKGVSTGTSTPKTQLLGSICPNCGSGNQAESSFCNNCGQALKVAPSIAPKTEPILTPSPVIPIPLPIQNESLSPISYEQSTTTPQKSNTPIFLIVGAAFLVAVLGFIALNSNNPVPTANNARPGNSTTKTMTPANVAKVNTPTPAANMASENTKPAANTASNSASPLIGRKGRLTKNLNIRSESNEYSEILGTHYYNAKIEILEIDSYFRSNGESVTWARVRVLEDGCDNKDGNGCGNNWERDGTFGQGEAEREGWMNLKYVILTNK